MSAMETCPAGEQELNKFHKVFHQLIDALVEYTSGKQPLNSTLVKHKVKYEAMVQFLSGSDARDAKVKIITTFDQQVRPFYEDVENGRLDFVDQVPIMHDIGLSEILADANQETVHNMLQYVRKLVGNARLWKTQVTGFAKKASDFSVKSLHNITTLLQSASSPDDLRKNLDVEELMSLAADPRFYDMVRGAMALASDTGAAETRDT